MADDAHLNALSLFTSIGPILGESDLSALGCAMSGVQGLPGQPDSPDDCTCPKGVICRQNNACPRLQRNPVGH